MPGKLTHLRGSPLDPACFVADSLCPKAKRVEKKIKSPLCAQRRQGMTSEAMSGTKDSFGGESERGAFRKLKN